jgi:hypothetical protein
LQSNRLCCERGLLGEPGEGGVDRLVIDFGTLVEVDRAELLAEDLVRPFPGVEPAEPDFGTVRQPDELVARRLRETQSGERQLRHLGQRIHQHRLPHRVGVKPQDGVAAARRPQRAHQQRIDQDEGFSGTRSAEEQDVAAFSAEQFERPFLGGGLAENPLHVSVFPVVRTPGHARGDFW